ncbi:hypothetical protein CRUP_002028 [Coryphaenoides rupestris]|nr:hypothetical protein CRUP_002028 [Coryphaenoides rupestris]
MLAHSSCPVQCSCFFHKLSDGSKARSVLCNDAEITVVPPNFPKDTSKLRIEKTAITRISSENFHYLNNLEFLWMSFNSIDSLSLDSFRGLSRLDELRLDGNAIAYFPWQSLTYMPNLRLLDLHNNKMSSIPAEATMYIQNITYLDLSSNALTTVPAEVLSMWLSVKPSQDADSTKRILVPEVPVLLRGPHRQPTQVCRPGGPLGAPFPEAELQRCQGPRVHTAVARVRSSLGNNVLLRCGTVGVPIPELTWSRADGKKMNGTVQQEISKEGIIWSILSVPAVSLHDSGRYICKATNFVGTADAIISLVITDYFRPEENGGASKRAQGKKSGGVGKAAYQDKLIARYVPPPTAPLRQLSPSSHPSTDKVPPETSCTPCLASGTCGRINVGAGKNRITIDGLVPKTKYIACVCVKGLIPKKEQCVIFSTDEAASASGTQKLINVVVITVACVIAVPLTLIVCCGALKKRCRKLLGKQSKEMQDSYVTFETLAPGNKAKGGEGVEGEYLARMNPDESNRLLSARSSVDSEATVRTEGPPNEYFC